LQNTEEPATSLFGGAVILFSTLSSSRRSNNTEKKRTRAEIWPHRPGRPLLLLGTKAPTRLQPPLLHLDLIPTRRRRLPIPLRPAEPPEERGRSPGRHGKTLKAEEERESEGGKLEWTALLHICISRNSAMKYLHQFYGGSPPR
jgi:hypothetical protein